MDAKRATACSLVLAASPAAAFALAMPSATASGPRRAARSLKSIQPWPVRAEAGQSYPAADSARRFDGAGIRFGSF
jgi:hypothetical protein